MAKSVAICGITGAVGKETLKCLDALDFPVSELSLYSSARSADKKIDTPFGEKTIKEFSVDDAAAHDYIFLCVSGSFSKENAHALIEGGKGIVIDNSSAFRYDDEIPLIVPEINADAIGDSRLIANPNCTTAILAVALYPLYKRFGLRRVIVSTYQATSGAGRPAMDELREQTGVVLNGGEPQCKNFAYPIPFNLIPQIDSFQENGYTREEMKVVWETKKIFEDSSLAISCTAVRIPIFRAHAEAVTIETERPVSDEEARAVLESASGVEVVDSREDLLYPMPMTAAEKFNVEVGRIRSNLVFDEFGLDFFVCGDQLLKGAALNAVQIAKGMI